MVDEKKLRNRKNVILNVTEKTNLVKLECASAILSFLMDNSQAKEMNFDVDSHRHMDKVLKKHNTEMLPFIFNMNKEYKILDRIIGDDGTFSHLLHDNKKRYNFMIDLIGKLRF